MSGKLRKVDISDVPVNSSIKFPEFESPEVPTVVYRVYQVACHDTKCEWYGVWDYEYMTRREANRVRDAHLKRYHAIQEPR